MYQKVDTERYRGVPPSLYDSILEMPRMMMELSSLFMMMPALSMMRKGDGLPVMVIPGFMGSDLVYSMLRSYLEHLGYQTFSSGVGSNQGQLNVLEALPERIDAINQQTGQKVSLIGHSLGGIYCRKIAHDHPERVSQVISLAAAIGAQDSGSSMRGMEEIFKMVSGNGVDEVQRIRDTLCDESPDVPTTSIYSKRDGVVHWSACCEKQEDESTQNIEILASHAGMAFNGLAYYVIADRLAQPEGQWQRFSTGLPGFART